MTKKSSARLARDAQKKHAKETAKLNNCWDDLNGIYQSCVGLMQSHSGISVCASNPEIIMAVEDKETLVSNINMLSNDLVKLNEELAELHKLHMDKSGGTEDPNEVMHSIGIFEQYNLFMERHDAVVMPTVTYILEQFDKAEHLVLRNRKKLQDELDATNARQLAASGGTEIEDAVLVEATPEQTVTTV